MSNVKISQLPAASAFSPAADVAPIVHSGVTQKATLNQIVQAVLPSPGPIGATTPGTAQFSALALIGASGLQKASAGVFTNAIAGTDYLGPTTGSAIQKANGTGGLTNAVSGTDYAPATSGNSILYGSGSGGFSNVTVGSGLSFVGGTLASTSSGGSVTTVSVVTANGFAGTVANASSTPAITLSTSITGLLKGNGTAISAAISGTDYAPATSGSSILYGDGAGGFSNVTIGSNLTFAGGTLSASGSTGVTSVTATTPLASSGGSTPNLTIQQASGSQSGYLSSTDWTTFNSKQPAGTYVTSISVASSNGLAGSSSGGATPTITLSTSVTGLLKGNGTAISAAVAGTDYAGLASANTFTDSQVISVSSASDALRITQTGAGNAIVVEDSANPDASPFVVEASGRVIVGYTSSQTFGGLSLLSLQINGTSQGTSSIATANWGTTVTPPSHIFSKSRGGAVGTHAVLSNNDNIGSLQFEGSDGTAFISAAAINAYVDGTPGTNDMPGRLVFSTTADGASSPTERMRIDSRGNVGIGGTPNAGSTLHLAKAITGATTSYGLLNNNVVQSDVTADAQYYSAVGNTAAAAFTLPTLRGYYYRQATFGAGSAVTNQYGFFTESDVTGATNNFGFYSNIASGTGRWNFYAAGTAANYFAGAVTINGTATLASGAVLNTPASGNLSNCTVDGTSSVGFRNVPQNSQSANYTTVLSDSGKHIFHPSTDTNARTFTIDSNANVAYPVGTAITFVNMSSSAVTIAITSDTMYLAATGSTGSRTLAQYGTATALKIASTTWLINGNGLT